MRSKGKRNPASDYFKEFRTEHIAEAPDGWHVKTIIPAPWSEHQVRIAFPPGRQRRGSGKLVSILHPMGENPKQCSEGLSCEALRLGQKNRKGNPVLESLLAGAAAGTAAVVAGRYLDKRAGNSAKQNKRLTVPEKHQRAIARATLKMPAAMRGVMGGPSRKEAKRILKRLSGNRRRNQGNGAAMYEDFHGRTPREVLELQEKLLTAGDYAALGDDPEIWLRPVSGDPNTWDAAEIEFEPANGVKLATKDGSQLYFMGGDQSLPDSALEFFASRSGAGADTSKRFLSLGTVYAISYVTEKKFDGFKRMPYAHILGEETGERPLLVYDTETKRVVLVGGAYSIAPVEGDLGASPGIVN